MLCGLCYTKLQAWYLLVINGNIIMGLLYKTYVFYLIAVEECFTSVLQVKSI